MIATRLPDEDLNERCNEQGQCVHDEGCTPTVRSERAADQVENEGRDRGKRSLQRDIFVAPLAREVIADQGCAAGHRRGFSHADEGATDQNHINRVQVERSRAGNRIKNERGDKHALSANSVGGPSDDGGQSGKHQHWKGDDDWNQGLDSRDGLKVLLHHRQDRADNRGGKRATDD
ncbi:hypothetical protein BGLA2_1740015 [Burkholderia gladioli]|nr:hypothetical protein BGLA2_1740015 [Burkholderia gladioli]